MCAQSPPEIAQTICDVGCKKTKLAVGKMFVLAMLAGAYIGFGAQFATAVKVGLADKVGVGFANLVGGAVFPVGLMLVVIGGAELFTGNNLISLACFHGPGGTNRIGQSCTKHCKRKSQSSIH